VKRRLQKMNAKSLKVEHAHFCGTQELDDMTKEKIMQLIIAKLEMNGMFCRQEEGWERQARTDRNKKS